MKLSTAIKNNNYEAFQKLNMSIDKIDSTAVEAAILRRYPENYVNRLLDNVTRPDVKSPIIIHAIKGKYSTNLIDRLRYNSYINGNIINALIENQYPDNYIIRIGGTPSLSGVINATKHSSDKLFEHLYYSLSFDDIEKLKEWRHEDYGSFLHLLLIHQRNEDIILYNISNSVITKRDKKFCTPLNIALDKNYPMHIIERLVYRDDQWAINTAVKAKLPLETIKFLCENCVDYINKRGNNVFMDLVSIIYDNDVLRLLAEYTTKSTVNSSSNSVLMVAIEWDASDDILEYLIGHPESNLSHINKRNKSTALSLMLQKNRSSHLVYKLLDKLNVDNYDTDLLMISSMISNNWNRLSIDNIVRLYSIDTESIINKYPNFKKHLIVKK